MPLKDVTNCQPSRRTVLLEKHAEKQRGGLALPTEKDDVAPHSGEIWGHAAAEPAKPRSVAAKHGVTRPRADHTYVAKLARQADQVIDRLVYIADLKLS